MIMRSKLKNLGLILALSAFSLIPLYGSEKTASWENLYLAARSDEQRYDIMQQIVGLKDQDFVPFYADSLEKVYASRIESADPYQTSPKLALAKLLVRELGDRGSARDARRILNVYQDVKDPYLKSEAALALAKMKATSAVEILARDLADLNLQPEAKRSRLMEVQAYGLVQALELMHSVDGYQSVFFASLGWYSSASLVRESAKAALATMMADPSPQLNSIISHDSDFSHKLMALKASQASTAPLPSKNEIARIALDLGLLAHESKVMPRILLAEVRTTAIAALIDNGDSSPQSVPLFQRVLENRDATVDELLACYAALGKNNSLEACMLLSQKLSDYNMRQKSGQNLPDDRKLVMQMLVSLKETKRPEAKPAVLEAMFSNHDGTVARTAKEVSEALP